MGAMSDVAELPVAVFDSGVGGLTVVKEMRAMLPLNVMKPNTPLDCKIARRSLALNTARTKT